MWRINGRYCTEWTGGRFPCPTRTIPLFLQKKSVCGAPWTYACSSVRASAARVRIRDGELPIHDTYARPYSPFSFRAKEAGLRGWIYGVSVVSRTARASRLSCRWGGVEETPPCNTRALVLVYVWRVSVYTNVAVTISLLRRVVARERPPSRRGFSSNPVRAYALATVRFEIPRVRVGNTRARDLSDVYTAIPCRNFSSAHTRDSAEPLFKFKQRYSVEEDLKFRVTHNPLFAPAIKSSWCNCRGSMRVSG